MKKMWREYGWILETIVGSVLFAVGFALFLEPNNMSPGGVSGIALVLIHILGFGKVGTFTILINLPLFVLGGLKIGKRFFFGSLLGMFLSSILIDMLAGVQMPPIDPVIAAIYGGVICGLGLGMVFICGSSTGGSDILARLLKLRYRNVPIGQITMTIDSVVAVMTGLVFHDMTKALYTGITVVICSKALDMVVYRFDYSHVALIISRQYAQIAADINEKLDRGATFLNGEGSYSHTATKVVLTAVKKRQITELKELVMELDPNAFVIVQEAHQVLGDGFARYSKNDL